MMNAAVLDSNKGFSVARTSVFWALHEDHSSGRLSHNEVLLSVGKMVYQHNGLDVQLVCISWYKIMTCIFKN